MFLFSLYERADTVVLPGFLLLMERLHLYNAYIQETK